MAGFLGTAAGSVDVRVVPHPAVTLVLEFGSGPLVVDAELDHTVVALDALWGKDAVHLRQRLGDATSWPQRFADGVAWAPPLTPLPG